MLTRGITIFILTILIACSKHNEFDAQYNVPEELQKHIDNFIKEAAIRGHSITIKNLIIQYDNDLQRLVCGNCNSMSLDQGIQKIISLNQNWGHLCWNNDLELETLVFHELGHCVLGREHVSTLLPKGYPKSIMIPDDVQLYSPCLYPIDGEPCDQSFKRKYYLDELFDPNTPVPDWGK